MLVRHACLKLPACPALSGAASKVQGLTPPITTLVLNDRFGTAQHLAAHRRVGKPMQAGATRFTKRFYSFPNRTDI